MTENKKPGSPMDSETVPGEMTEAEIDQNLKDTFPASDPPSWTLGTDHPHKTKTEPVEASEDNEGK